MSGIAGVVHFGKRSVDHSSMQKLQEGLEIRGAGTCDKWVHGGVGFVYSQGPACARQQAFISQGAYAVVADARIDGRDDLLGRFEPECRETLRDASDAGVILAGYQRWGAALLDSLIGDFSFAIWDGAKRRLLCARDQFGVKPFFYAASQDFLLFSNRIDCLIEAPEDLDRLAVADFLLFGRYLDADSTAFSGIRRLPGGHVVEWQDGATKIRRYWTLPVGVPIRFRRQSDYIEGFQHHLSQAVRDRVDPDRTAVLMSGGLDSTMVASVAARHSPVKAFAIVYDRLVPDPERRYAQRAADAIGIPLDCLAADDYALLERTSGSLQEPAEPVDEPLPSIFTDHMVRVMSYSHVALTGVGGDQLLFPSPDFATRLLKTARLPELAIGLYRFMRLRRKIPAVGFRSGMLRALGAARQPKQEFPPWLNPDLVKSLDLRQRWQRVQDAPKGCHPDRPEAFAQLTDPVWASIFETYDAGTTKIPVEVRHPLFDTRLVQYCLGLPPIPWFVDKTLARAAMQDHLPPEIRLRPKSFASDAVAARLAATPALDTWRAVPELEQFVDRSRVPALIASEKAWDPHHRPLLLNRWLFELTRKRSRCYG